MSYIEYIEKEEYINLEMENNLIKKETSICNGNVICNGYYEGDLSSDNKPEEALVSDTLVFYVNGKQVCNNKFSFIVMLRLGSITSSLRKILLNII